MERLANNFSSVFLLAIGLISISSVTLANSDSIFDDPLFKAWVADMKDDRMTNGNLADDPFPPTVRIKNGTLQGQIRYTGNTKTYRFLGIPYAKPPIKELRFQAPQPYEGWGNKTFQATRHPNACPQILTSLTFASEDCLYLSVYTRRNVNDASDNRLLPVVYWIHGGAYVLGQNSYFTGSTLLKEDEIVLVTVQYRLGPLGFFSTGDNTVSANNGMKDMVQGLRWVQENIEAFGGDPNQVTVMGESAGSAASLYMLISPLAQGLFHKVIALSGSPLQEWAIDRNPEQTSKRLATFLKCPTENNTALVECMMGKRWIPIMRAGLAVIFQEFGNFGIFLPGSSVTIEEDKPGAFLTDDPLKLFMEGPLPNVPVILGTTQHEGILPMTVVHYFILEPNGLRNDPEYMRNFFLGDMLKTYGVNERINGASMSQTLALAFMPPEADLANLTEYQYELLDAVSVAFMKAPVLRTASILSRRLPAVYLYSFEHYSNNSFYYAIFKLAGLFLGYEPPMKPGVGHGEDLFYLFAMPFVLSPESEAFSQTYVRMLNNFIIHGNPTPVATDKFEVWPKFEDRGKYYMRLANQFEVKKDYTASWRQGMPDFQRDPDPASNSSLPNDKLKVPPNSSPPHRMNFILAFVLLPFLLLTLY